MVVARLCDRAYNDHTMTTDQQKRPEWTGQEETTNLIELQLTGRQTLAFAAPISGRSTRLVTTPATPLPSKAGGRIPASRGVRTEFSSRPNEETMAVTCSEQMGS